MAEVMLRLDPAEICRLARLSRAFRGAATADFMWETKLPGKSDSKGLGFLTKKEIYAQLCRRNPFDGELRVLGMVVDKVKRATVVSYLLDDGTGRIEINRW